MDPDPSALGAQRLHDRPLPSPSIGRVPSYQDIRRQRELYRYFDPDDITFERTRIQNTPHVSDRVANKAGLQSPNVALTAYSQLAALRCHAQRAMVSLIDKEIQYFVAESSKTLDFENNDIYEEEGDALWAGCQGVSKAGRLCERTIELQSGNGDSYPTFVVNDLSQDDRFAELPFVAGPPYFRFYAGTPVTTKRGINIGSLFVLDDKPRDGLTKLQESVLGSMATQCMSYLETYREAMEGRRATRMSDALNCFVEGKASLIYDIKHLLPQTGGLGDKTSSSSSHVLSDTPGSMMSPQAPDIGTTRKQSGKSPPPVAGSDSSDIESHPRAAEGKRKSDDSRGHPWTFARAANLMRESLEIDGDGGVVFFEATRDLTFGSMKKIDLLSRPSEAEIIEQDVNDLTPGSAPTKISRVKTTSTFEPLANAFQAPKLQVPILASSTASGPFTPGGWLDLGGSKAVDRTVLLEMLKRYPQGKLWVLDEDGSLSSSEEEIPTSDATQNQTASKTQPGRSRRKQMESDTLRSYFPSARQLLFVPLWDAATSKWFSGCFVYATGQLRVFSIARELSFLNSFGKTVMAECSRLDTLVSDRQKSDFIGSVSHELRSPLHGILASTEFLNDTTTDSFQRSLIETIEGCGRTLLDTINHVLDFSKINSFERAWKGSKSHKASRNALIGGTTAIPAKPLPTGAPPLLRLYAATDLAAVTEEVVEGVFIGRAFDRTTDITDLSANTRGQSAGKGSFSTANPPNSRLDQPVEVILYVEKGNWVFMTQPGALRRVIMNVFGNAVKYTSQGTIKVRLQLREIQSPSTGTDNTPKMVDITISDTGKGISQDFLEGKLYVPFAQENTLAPGTGLGLSIVHSIITMLGGSIEIKSEVGRGTTVQISLPLIRPIAGEESPANTPGSGQKESDGSIHLLQQEAKNKVVAIDGLALDAAPPAPGQKLGSSDVLARYVEDWYGLKVVPWSKGVPCDVVITDERSASSIMKGNLDAGVSGLPGIIVLSGHSTQKYYSIPGGGDRIIEYLSKPYGPFKLARALRSCLERLNAVHHGTLDPIPEVTSPGVPSPHTLDTVIEGLHEVTLAPLNKSGRDIVAQTNGTITIAENSKTAHMAMSTPLDENGPGSVNESTEYPFPSPNQQREIEVGKTSPSAKTRLSLKPTSSPSKTHDTHNRSSSTSTISKEDIMPRVLLVDDNAINLRLLQTFMRKRKYKHTDSAEDGRMAVEAVQNYVPDTYDIIFMDISMPVMNGFEATRAIREFEKSQSMPAAMVIALTGLANSRDQSEAFESGIDLYLTKPVSFKEVAKLLDNWEANRKALAMKEG